MLEVEVTVTMNPIELKLFRRALAKAADDHLLDPTVALRRICALDVLRWKAEDKASKVAKQRAKKSTGKRAVMRATHENNRTRKAA